jgi:HD-GYP domain-containing protein (c-di-GMP phosphodiesterase class II)
MRILVVQEDNAIRNGVSVLLEIDLAAEVVGVAKSEDALATLQSNPLVIYDALVCNDAKENEPLLAFLKEHSPATRVFTLKNPKAKAVLSFPDQIVGSVNPLNLTEEVKALFKEKIPTLKPVASDDEEQNYCRVRALGAMQKSPLNFDLFVRLSAKKFVRVFKEGDVFTEKDVTAFLEKKKIEYLYFLKADAIKYAASLREDLEKAAKGADTNPEGATRAAVSAHEAVMELGNKIGFTPEVQALAKQGMLSTLRAVGGSSKPQLGKILKGIIAKKEEYIGYHAILTGQIACSLANGMEWSSDTTYQKLTFAAFFHDMVLTNGALAQVGSVSELETRKSEFTEEEQKRFRFHTLTAAQIINTFSEVPADVSVIISQHHEKPDGSGFPRGLAGQNIAPLSALFIIAHDLVGYIFEHGTEGIETFFADYKAKYSMGHFRKILSQIDIGKLGV